MQWMRRPPCLLYTSIDVPAEKCYAKIEGSEQGVFEYYGTNTICFKSKDWERLTRANKGCLLYTSLVKPNIKVANTQKIVLMTLYFKELRMQK